ncbi:hypothetical protein BT69DRAFT_1289306 [Atractiella rhizophila]|nr:hypothetical protein BT69DRAFT_1289306 [Atractiella rhizophila]
MDATGPTTGRRAVSRQETPTDDLVQPTNFSVPYTVSSSTKLSSELLIGNKISINKDEIPVLSPANATKWFRGIKNTLQQNSVGLLLEGIITEPVNPQSADGLTLTEIQEASAKGEGYVTKETTAEDMEKYIKALMNFQKMRAIAMSILKEAAGETARVFIEGLEDPVEAVKILKEKYGSQEFIDVAYLLKQLLNFAHNPNELPLSQWIAKLHERRRQFHEVQDAVKINDQFFALILINGLTDETRRWLSSTGTTQTDLAAVVQRLTMEEVALRTREEERGSSRGNIALVARMSDSYSKATNVPLVNRMSIPESTSSQRTNQSTRRTNSQYGSGSLSMLNVLAPNAREVPNWEKWPHGVTGVGKFRVGNRQCFNCGQDGHFGKACPHPREEQAKSLNRVFKIYGINLPQRDGRALVSRISDHDTSDASAVISNVQPQALFATSDYYDDELETVDFGAYMVTMEGGRSEEEEALRRESISVVEGTERALLIRTLVHVKERLMEGDGATLQLQKVDAYEDDLHFKLTLLRLGDWEANYEHQRAFRRTLASLIDLALLNPGLLSSPGDEQMNNEFEALEQGEDAGNAHDPPTTDGAQDTDSDSNPPSLTDQADVVTAMFIGESVAADSPFYVDTGASFHLTVDRELLHGYRELERPIVIKGAFGSMGRAIGVGNLVAVFTLSGGRRTTGTFTNVYYAPSLGVNLLAPTILMQQGVTVTNDTRKMYFHGRDGRMFGEAVFERGLVTLQCRFVRGTNG